MRDIQIAEDIMQIIEEEILRIKQNPNREAGDIVLMEKLSKTYSVIMASNREVFKSGMLGGLELDDLGDGGDETGDEAEDA